MSLAERPCSDRQRFNNTEHRVVDMRIHRYIWPRLVEMPRWFSDPESGQRTLDERHASTVREDRLVLHLQLSVCLPRCGLPIPERVDGESLDCIQTHLLALLRTRDPE